MNKDEKIDLNIVRPLAGFNQRMKLIRSFKFWPLSLGLGIILLGVYEKYNWILPLNIEWLKNVIYWVMIVALTLGFVTPMAKLFTGDYDISNKSSSKPPLTSSFIQRFVIIFLLLIGLFIFMFLLFAKLYGYK